MYWLPWRGPPSNVQMYYPYVRILLIKISGLARPSGHEQSFRRLTGVTRGWSECAPGTTSSIHCAGWRRTRSTDGETEAAMRDLESRLRRWAPPPAMAVGVGAARHREAELWDLSAGWG